MVDGEGELDGFGARFPLDGALARCCAVRSASFPVACERRRRGNMVSEPVDKKGVAAGAKRNDGKGKLSGFVA